MGDAARDDAPRDTGGSSDPDGPPPPTDAADECGGKRWVADFSSDPTVLDVNGDQIPDWIYRGGGAFPTVELSNGVWHIPSANRPPLDTRPVNDFSTKTIVHARLKGSLPNNGTKGAVVYMNFAFTPPIAGNTTFATALVDAKKENNGTQTLTLWTLDGGGNESAVSSTVGLPDQFLDVTIELDPTVPSVKLVGPTQSTLIPVVRRGGNDNGVARFFSLLGYSTAGDFDYISIEVCP